MMSLKTTYMKKSIISAISKLTLGIALCTAFVTANAQSATEPTGKNVNVKYLGVTSDDLVFNVAFDNPNGNKFSVIVLDQEGTPMYQETYSDKVFERRFRLPMTDNLTDNHKVTFIIRDYRDADWKQSFTINSRITEDLVVTKVK
jgi:hypothetical protein